MRKGFEPVILLDKRGEIFVIATGADACAEHEGGSAAMQKSLCQGQAAENPDGQLIDALRQGKAVVYPALLDRKQINQNLEAICFKEGTDKLGRPQALISFSGRHAHELPFDYSELRSYKESEEHVTACWDSHSFAIRVVGEKWVKKLRRFAEKLKAGECLFAGTFMQDHAKEHLSGVIIAAQNGLRPEHREAIAKAQSQWEASLRLKAKSRLDELYAVYRQQKSAELPGFLWPVWKNEVDGEVLYALNPGYQVDAAYFGPYTYDQLLEWTLAEKKFPLRPLK